MATEENKKVNQNRLKKEGTVEQLKQKLDASNSIVLTDYQGLTHKQIEGLKKQLKAVNSTFSITKNTLLKLSLNTSKNYADKISEEKLENPTATLFISGDVVEALKSLAKINKETGLPKIKIGIIDGEVLDEAQIIRISSLPPRNVLIAQFVGTLNSPIQGLVVALNANIQKFVMTLDAIAKNKPATPAPATEPATTEGASEPKEEASVPTTVPNEVAPEPATTQDEQIPNEAGSEEKPTQQAEQVEQDNTESEGGDK